MAFLAYVAILLVSISGILLELNWLTQPKLEAKPAMHAMSAPPSAAVRRVVAKVDRPNAERDPVYPKQADTPPAIEMNAEAPKAATAPAVAEVPMPPARPQEAEQANAGDPPPAAAAQPQAIANASLAEKAGVTAKLQCDVAACAGAYTSFRESDCTFSPTKARGAFAPRRLPHSNARPSAGRGGKRRGSTAKRAIPIPAPTGARRRA
jgi:cytoskeletal protein RodZ